MSGAKPSLLLRALHAAANGLHCLGVGRSKLDADEMIAQAKKKTGLSDAGPEPWSEALRQLVNAYNGDNWLSPMGRSAVRGALTGIVVNRLNIMATVHADPGLRDEHITRPIFVLGFPRTGTTWLFQLLSQDPSARPLQTWEAMKPYPSPRPETYESDPRIAMAERGLRGLDWLFPQLRVMHPIKARGPEECLPLLWNSFMTPFFRGRVEPYRHWLRNRPEGEFHTAYAFHRLQLQILQRHVKRQRWLLKCPAHLYCLDSLLHVYPDAVVVQTHRDPQSVIPSWCSMSAAVDPLYYQNRPKTEVGERSLGICRDVLARQRRVRATLPAGRIIDVGYNDLLADPRAVVERIYRTGGLEYTPEFDASVRQHIDRDRQTERPKHRYAPEDFGLTRERIDHELADYLHDFGPLCGRNSTGPTSTAVGISQTTA